MIVRKKPGIETAQFQGRVYTRRPDSKDYEKRWYFRAWSDKSMQYLHRAIYESVHGPLLDGLCVHHADGNPLNNDPANLVAVSASEHARIHSTERFADPAYRARTVATLNQIRPLASAWHASDGGRAWHVAHGVTAYASRDPRRYECRQCGAAYETLHARGGYCSPACRSKMRRQSGVDNERRQCLECHAEFVCNRYDQTRTCSRRCASHLGARLAKHDTAVKTAGIQERRGLPFT